MERTSDSITHEQSETRDSDTLMNVKQDPKMTTSAELGDSAQG